MAVTIDQLEPRIFLSQTPASPRPETLGAPFDKGERQVLLDRLTAIPSGTRTTLQNHLNSNSVGSFDSLLRSHFQARTGTNFYFAPANAGSIASYIAGTLGDSGASVRSDKIVDDRLFPQDTSTADFTVSLPANINWQNPGVSPSPDFIHALHRFQYWNDLALTYLDTGNSKYVQEMMYQLADWHSEMQVITSPPAATSDTAGWQLDTSIRTENFVWAYFSLLNDAGWTNASNSLLLYKIVQHGDFLYSEAATNLDTASNRTLTLAKGLHYLGVLFPEVNNSADWAVAGRNLLFASMDGQFYDDGGHVEQSPGYTVNAIEDLLESKHLDALNGTSWPGTRSTKLSNAVTSYWQMLSLDGSRPAISDTYRNTSVTLFLKANEIQNVTTWPEANPRPRDAWLFGTAFSNSKIGNPVTPAMGNRGDTYAMTDAGYYVMRSGNTTSDRQIIFDIGPKGGIHGHFDTLNFELWGGGRPLIKDPGPFKYDNSADRSYVISTRAHNTINIAGNNIGELEGANNPGLQVSQWAVSGSSAQITATHRGYQHLAGRPVVTRSMWYDLDGTIVIVDFVESN
ncbi:MAG TPA: alginate lyase family protein, partial [Tepidisphaeraceae bacterium]|nr:alginate lyase family protein [Tepidisphaeraceae bacterium]